MTAATKEIVRRFAELGYDAICPNLYYREAPGAAPDDAAATARAQGGVPDERLVGDVAGAAAYLRSLASSNGKVGVIGYCSGGRQSVLAACNLDLDAAVDCYGAFVTGDPARGLPAAGDQPRRPAAEPARAAARPVRQRGLLPEPRAGRRARPDPRPSTDKPHEFHRYDDAGHAFFSVDRPSYRVAAANDGWERIAAFYAHLPRRLTMCTYATVKTALEGSAKGPDSKLVPRHRRRPSTSTIPCTRWPSTRSTSTSPTRRRGPGARVAVELTAASARELVAAIEAALDSAPDELKV